MQNHKIMPFERNRYFYGKLLTVRDFEIEQKYFNDKRRMINRIAIGPGVLSGLEVMAIDDKTLLVEPGVAIDYMGREVVIDTPFTTRLSMLEGFQDIGEYSQAYLLLEYNETEKEHIHSIAENESDSEFNRFKESFKLRLVKEPPALPHDIRSSVIGKPYALVDNDAISIALVLDHTASQHDGYDVTLKIELKQEIAPIKLKMILSAVGINQGREMTVAYDSTNESKEQRYIKRFHFDVDALTEQDTMVRLQYFELKIGENHLQIPLDQIKHAVKIGSSNTYDMILEKYNALSLEDQTIMTSDDVICLARLDVIKTDETFIIDSIEVDPFEQHIMSNQMLQVLVKKMLPILGGNRQEIHPANTGSAVAQNDLGVERYQMTTGHYTFRFSDKANAKEKFFSEEINHQLGSGEVFIELALDTDSSGGDLAFGHQSQMLQGDFDIFEKTSYESILPNVKMGSINYKNKGKFIVGIQFLESFSRDELVVKWRATKVNRFYASLTEKQNGLIIEPAMAKVSIRQQVNFTVLHEDKPIICKWHVKGELSGEIDDKGVYMSPSREGVYEIIAEVPALNESLSAYVIVENDETD